MTATEVKGSNFDVLVVGAGIIGLSIAWQIARRSNLRIAVLERGAGVGEGSTGASSAVCRFRYSHDEVVSLARDGIACYQQWKAFTGRSEVRAEYQRDGVLWIPGDDREWAGKQHDRMTMLGVNSEVLDVEEAGRRYPDINTCARAPDLLTGEDHDCDHRRARWFLESDGGYMDPVSAAQDLVSACRTAGVEVCFRCPVESIAQSHGRVTGVRISGQRGLSSPLVINAAGPWCRDLYEQAGVPLNWDLKPVRIQVLHRSRPPQLQGPIPVTVDMPGGIYFRTQNRGQQLIIGSILEEDEREAVADPDHYQQQTDTEFELEKLHALHHRIPALDYASRISGYCGLYTVNHDDVHPIVGPTTVEGFWVANGFSGHGFKLAPAIGAMIAKAVTGERSDFDTTVPLSFLSIDRSPLELDSKSVLA